MTAAPAARASAFTGNQSILGVLSSEWIKLRTLRSTWVTTSITAAVTILIGTGAAIGLAKSGSPEQFSQAKEAIIFGASLGQIVVAVLGALVITGEYSSGQIRSSLAAVPRRGRLVLAKALTVAVFAFLVGFLSVLAAWAISAPFMDGHAGSLADAEYFGYIWGSGLQFAGIALLAFSIGALVRSTAGAITSVVVLMFVIDIPLGLLTLKWDWATQLMGLLPATVSTAIADPLNSGDTWGVEGTRAFLEHWQALAVFGAWVFIPLALAAIVFTKRDA